MEPASGDVVAAAGAVRGTQSFVHTLAACWRRPSLTALEVAVAVGVWDSCAAVGDGMRRRGFWRQTPVDFAALRRMTVMDPMGAAETMAQAMAVLLPSVTRVAMWLVPLLLVVWVVVSSLGRTVVLRRADSRLQARPGTLMVLQAMRMVALAWELCGVVSVRAVGSERYGTGTDCCGWRSRTWWATLHWRLWLRWVCLRCGLW